MSRRIRLRRYLVAAAALVAGVAAITVSQAQSGSDQWWPGYGNGPDNSRYFASRQINKSNVNQLQVAWTYPYGETGSVPIVVRGVVYGRGRNGSLVAVDAKTGKELWVRENMTGMTSRGVNYWESRDGRDQRLIFAMNSLLQEVDAKTGKSIMTFGTNGVVDLREGIDGRDPATIGNIQSNTPGEVFENLMILGSATGEGLHVAARRHPRLRRPHRQARVDVPYRAPARRVRLRHLAEGRLQVHRRHQHLGRDDGRHPARHRLHPARFADLRLLRRRSIGANLFGTSIVALDARTGKRLWHFQIVHHDLWDLDPSAAPQLTTIRHNGRNRDVVVVTAKTGWLYVFDRVTGEPIWPIEERPVPKSEMAARTELADAAVPDQPAAVCQAHLRRRRHQSVPASGGSRGVQEAPAGGGQQGHLHADQPEGHRARADEQRRHALRRHGGRTRHWRRVHHRARQPRHPPAASPGRRTPAAAVAAVLARAELLPAALPAVPRRRSSRARPACRSCTPRPSRPTTSRRARRASTRRRFAPSWRREGPHAGVAASDRC